jgi:adenylate cyclase
MPRRLLRGRAPIIAGVSALALLLAAMLLMPGAWREILREIAFDRVLSADAQFIRTAPDRSSPRIIVLDIDRRSIEALGPWPWPRDAMARVVEAVADGKPAAIAIDILFVEPDAQSPAALARLLAARTGRTDLLSLAAGLADGDRSLAQAFRLPVALGFALDPDASTPVQGVPIATRGPLPIDNLWRASGATGPLPLLAEAAAGIGALSLPGDADGMVRRVPLLVGVGDTLRSGLALEAVRLARQTSVYLIQSAPPTLTTGDLQMPLPRDALLRLVPVAAEHRAARTISVADVMAGTANASRLAGAIVLLGASAPELGGLRQTPADPLTPSVQIQADAVTQMFSGRAPRSLDRWRMIEPSVTCAAGLLGVAAGAALSPIVGALATMAFVALAWASSLGLSIFADRLVDPLMPSLAAALSFMVTSVAAYAATRRREALVRHRFEQHLAPAVVRRIVEDPGLVKLAGERREVTALFTDIEGFTAMTHRTDPERLVAVLDGYFEGAAAIIVEHGGMVVKIIGDAVHALFNAPIDLDDHPKRALECAVALRTWIAAYRDKAEPSAIGLGRTRIGIETGLAVVGDVGILTKLDYTAHGDAINAAARLEVANKELCSTICVGPVAAARCDADLLRPLGTITVRGYDEPLAVFEPWPADAPRAWRDKYRDAFRSIVDDPLRAAVLFEQLAGECPADPVPRLMAKRLSAAAQR